MRIIDGDALFEDLKECMQDSRLTSLQINGIALAATRIFEQPTIEPEREKGELIPVHPLQSDDCGAYMCSKCKTGMWEIRPSVYHYCPNCGKPMKRGKQDG